MTKPAHDNLQSAMWKEQLRQDLKGYSGPRKEEIQRKE